MDPTRPSQGPGLPPLHHFQRNDDGQLSETRVSRQQQLVATESPSDNHHTNATATQSGNSGPGPGRARPAPTDSFQYFRPPTSVHVVPSPRQHSAQHQRQHPNSTTSSPNPAQSAAGSFQYFRPPASVNVVPSTPRQHSAQHQRQHPNSTTSSPNPAQSTASHPLPNSNSNLTTGQHHRHRALSFVLPHAHPFTASPDSHRRLIQLGGTYPSGTSHPPTFSSTLASAPLHRGLQPLQAPSTPQSGNVPVYSAPRQSLAPAQRTAIPDAAPRVELTPANSVSEDEDWEAIEDEVVHSPETAITPRTNIVQPNSCSRAQSIQSQPATSAPSVGSNADATSAAVSPVLDKPVANHLAPQAPVPDLNTPDCASFESSTVCDSDSGRNSDDGGGNNSEGESEDEADQDNMKEDKGKRKASQEPQSPAAAKRPRPDEDAMEVEVAPKMPAIPFPEKPAVIEERNGEIEFRVVNNDNERESLIILTGLKCIFQKQLPKMPKDYIARLVYDRTHLSIAIVKKPLEVVGGITYRPFKEREFAEIVFCAISSDQQVKGYGAHLMSHLKDYVKSTSPVMHFLTYADNYAIGYFKKQGFTKDITLDKSVWMGYIKDYEGGTIMQCTMLPRIRYLESGRMLLKQKEAVMAKIRAFSKSHVIHQPPKQWKNGVTPIDPMKIEAIRNSGWSPEMDELARQPRHGVNYNQLLHLLNAMQNHQSAWPFLNPVNKDEVQDYYEVIKEPMDLSTMEQKLEMDQYPNPEDFLKDAMLIFKNCRKYNSEGTPYTKSANKLEKFMWTKMREIPEWSHFEEEFTSKK